MRERETCTQCGNTYEITTGGSQGSDRQTCTTCGASLASSSSHQGEDRNRRA